MKISFDLSQMRKALNEKREQIHIAARPAAQAGAQVLYDQARINVPVSTKGHWFHGTSFKLNGTKYWFNAGTLRDSIYQVFSADNSGATRATYHVSWNAKKAPYGHMVEWGTRKAPAHSFIGRTIREKGQAAEQAMKAEFLDRIKA